MKFISARLVCLYLVKNVSTWYRGCLHTGHRVTRFLRQSIESRDATARHAAVFATQAGSLGYVAPLLDQSAEPLLQKLQRQMVLAQPQPAGLNPAAFRYRRKRNVGAKAEALFIMAQCAQLVYLSHAVQLVTCWIEGESLCLSLPISRAYAEQLACCPGKCDLSC